MTRKQFIETVNSHGATIDEFKTGPYHDITIDAPEGKQWVANGLPILCMDIAGQPAVAYTDAVERMNYGLEDLESED